jgi:pimeloyl-ACP methyl ester carboxylesterase
VRETAHLFGSHGGLAGVLCLPAAPAASAPAVVFWNVGLNHRVGPNRTWVEFARALAGAGFPSLRFDLSGLGDSAPRSDGPTDSERAALDVTEALDFLEQRGVASRFVLVANCSGVDSLHAVALEDPRVAGVVHIDGYAYRNAGYAWRRALLRLLQPERWRRFLLHRRHHRSGQEAVAMEKQQLWKRDIPSRERYARDMAALVGRGVQVLLVFTGGLDLQYNHRKQFHDSFGHRGAVDVEFYPRFDHLLSRADDRRTVCDRLCGFMRRAFPEAATPAAAGDARKTA